MIGVISPAEQAGLVAEFFELFKTPWEFFRPGRSYDAVLATTSEIPAVDAKLLIVYGAENKNVDAELGLVTRQAGQGALVAYRHMLLPIYGKLLTFSASKQARPLVNAGRHVAGLVIGSTDRSIVRIGYDLFEEMRFLLSTGQPVEYAHIPTLDLHIRMLRDCILHAGIPLLEILPAPFGYDFAVCLTHDIDFVGIRNHRFDHSMWGFVYRATFGAVRNAARGRLSLSNLLKSWLSVASLPFVFARWAKDFWDPFDWYVALEKGLASTYFLIPFKGRPGEKVPGRHPSRRACAYDVADLSPRIKTLRSLNCEIGVHGLDAWHSSEKGKEELVRIAALTGQPSVGIRMHWLCYDGNSPAVLEQAGYTYDSTCGYNETIGYRAGTGQVFRPLGARTLLELPLHIQDGAMFLPHRLDLSEAEAEQRCQLLVENGKRFGGVLTLLWHDRSHAPERFWGNFYVNLLHSLRSMHVWFATASQVVNWFEKRRQVSFEVVEKYGSNRVILRYKGEEIAPPLTLRVHRPYVGDRNLKSSEPDFVDIPWNGHAEDELGLLLQKSLEGLNPTETVHLHEDGAPAH